MIGIIADSGELARQLSEPIFQSRTTSSDRCQQTDGQIPRQLPPVSEMEGKNEYIDGLPPILVKEKGLASPERLAVTIVRQLQGRVNRRRYTGTVLCCSPIIPALGGAQMVKSPRKPDPPHYSPFIWWNNSNNFSIAAGERPSISRSDSSCSREP